MKFETLQDFISLGYSPACSKEELLGIHYKYVVPWLRDNILTAEHDLFLALCLYSFNILGLSHCENDLEFDQWYKSIFNPLKQKIACLRGFRKKKFPIHEIPKIVFFIVAKTSAKTYMLPVIQAMAENNNFECHVVPLGFEKNDTVYTTLQEYGCKIHYLDFDFSGAQTAKSVSDLKKYCDEYDFDCAVTGCSQIIATIIHESDIARINVFFSHFLHAKMQNYGYPHHLTYGSPALKYQNFSGEKCRVLPQCFDETPSAFFLPDNNLRSKYAEPGQIILGTFARSAKVNQPQFLEAVAGILEETENTVFIHTSDTNYLKYNNTVSEFFAAKGLSERVKDIGWVDLDVFIPLVDIVLDSFPMANGTTLLKAMQYKKPVIAMSSPYSFFGRDLLPLVELYEMQKSGVWPDPDEVNTGFFTADRAGILNRMLGVRQYFSITSQKEYIKNALSLISDFQRQESFGNILGDIYQNVYQNTKLMTDTFTRHITEIIDYENKTCSFTNAKLPAFPTSVIAISNFGRCVNRCKFCLQSHPLFAFKAGEKVVAPRDLFAKVLSELPHSSVQYVSCTPYSETVFEKEVIPRVKMVREHGFKPTFETSAVYFDEAFFKEIFEAGLHRVLISINAPTRELYKKVHGRDNFDRVVANADKIIDLRNRGGYDTKIHIHIMLFKEFLPYYKEFHEIWSKKVDYIYGQALCNWGHDKWTHANYSETGLTPLKVKDARRYPCPSLSATMVLHPDGHYYICGMGYNQYMRGKTVGCLGNAEKITYLEAWNRLAFYRKMHLEGRWDELECCKNCNAWLTWILRIEDIKLDGDEIVLEEEDNAC